jgi:hypothetical protein
MQNGQLIAGEIRNIERQYPLDSMNVHRCGQPGVMNLDAEYAVFDDQTLPFRIGSRRVRQESQDMLDLFDLAKNERDRKAKTIIFYRDA